jgi:hypothetical protein
MLIPIGLGPFQEAAGGAAQCNPLSVTAFTTLLAAAGPCEQQNAADQMIDLAKQLNNDAAMIKLAQTFCQQPRNTVGLFCPTHPRLSFSKRSSAKFGERPVLPAGAKELGTVGTVPVPIRWRQAQYLRRGRPSWKLRNDPPRAFFSTEPSGFLPGQPERPHSRRSAARQYRSEPRLWRRRRRRQQFSSLVGREPGWVN